MLPSSGVSIQVLSCGEEDLTFFLLPANRGGPIPSPVLKRLGGVSSVGRASAWHAEGQRFESATLHHFTDDDRPKAGFFVNSPLNTMLKGQDLALACAKAADDLKAEDVRIFDLRGISTLTDFMMVCSGNSLPHLKAIVREVEGSVREKGSDPALYTEGKAASRWVVLDFVDVMVHVLDEEFREHYALESLWGDAKELAWNDRDED